MQSIFCAVVTPGVFIWTKLRFRRIKILVHKTEFAVSVRIKCVVMLKSRVVPVLYPSPGINI